MYRSILHIILTIIFSISLVSVNSQSFTDPVTKSVSINTTTLKVYPNPAADEFSISNDQGIKAITIFNLVGKKLDHLQHNTGDLHSITDYPKGVYILRLFDEQNDVVKVLRLRKK